MQTNGNSRLTVAKRVKSATPPFFKKIRNVGLIVAAVGGAIIASPVALPAIISKLASYIMVAGTVMTSISQVTVEEDLQLPEESDE
jgi:hypothetical protein